MSIVARYSEKISRIISEPDSGIYDAMSMGIGVATGDIVGILKSDDIYSSEEVIDDAVSTFVKKTWMPFLRI